MKLPRQKFVRTTYHRAECPECGCDIDVYGSLQKITKVTCPSCGQRYILIDDDDDITEGLNKLT